MNFFTPGKIFKAESHTEEPVGFNVIFINKRLLKVIIQKNWSLEWLRKGFAVAEPVERGYQVVFVSPATMTLLIVKTKKTWVFKPYAKDDF